MRPRVTIDQNRESLGDSVGQALDSGPRNLGGATVDKVGDGHLVRLFCQCQPSSPGPDYWVERDYVLPSNRKPAGWGVAIGVDGNNPCDGHGCSVRRKRERIR